MECPVCLEPYNLAEREPQVLPCSGSHEVCAACVALLRDSAFEGIFFNCPHCRESIDHASRVNPNRGLLAALQMLSSEQQTQSPSSSHPTRRRQRKHRSSTSSGTSSTEHPIMTASWRGILLAATHARTPLLTAAAVGLALWGFGSLGGRSSDSSTTVTKASAAQQGGSSSTSSSSSSSSSTQPQGPRKWEATPIPVKVEGATTDVEGSAGRPALPLSTSTALEDMQAPLPSSVYPTGPASAAPLRPSPPPALQLQPSSKKQPSVQLDLARTPTAAVVEEASAEQESSTISVSVTNTPAMPPLPSSPPPPPLPTLTPSPMPTRQPTRPNRTPHPPPPPRPLPKLTYTNLQPAGSQTHQRTAANRAADADPNHYRVGGPLDLMFQAVMSNDPEVIDRTLGMPDADIDIPGPEGQTPLFFAVMKGKIKAVKRLLLRGANARMLQDQGFGPLDAAGFMGRHKIAKVLLAHGLDPNEMRQDGFNSLHRAIWGNTQAHTETVKVLLEAGVSPSRYAKAAKYGAQTQEMLVRPIDMVEHNSETLALLKQWVAQEDQRAQDDASLEVDSQPGL